MGVSGRLLLLIALCLAPAVAGEVLIARGLLPAIFAVPASIAAALVLAGLAERLSFARAASGTLEREVRESAHSASPPAEFETLTGQVNGLAGDSARQRDFHRQSVERLQAALAERSQALSDCNNRLQVALADIARIEAVRGPTERQRIAGQLAGGVAHDFNNLLATVLGCLELMERRLTDPDRLHTLIARASDAVDRATKLTSGLVHFSRRQSQPRRPSDLNALVSDLTPLIASALGRRVRLTAELAPMLDLGYFDPAGIEMALVGMCLAARAAIPGGGHIVLATGAEADAPGPTVPDPSSTKVCCCLTIVVEADGLGEPDLASTRLAAEAAGAAVRLSRSGSILEISLLLPCAQRGADQPRTPAPPVEHSRRSLNLRILLVDDDESVRQMTASMLRELNCTVLEAGDGPAALVLLEGDAHGADLLVLDYAMPRMNGLELARALRARHVTAPIMLVTGYADLAERSKAAREVLDLVLRKPFTIDELHEAITGLQAASGSSANVISLHSHSG